MRIALVTPEFVSEPYFSGGLANYTYRVGRWLAGLGHEVHVVTLSQRDEQLNYKGVVLHRVRSSSASTARWRFTRERLWFAWKASQRLLKLHRAAPLDVIQYSSYFATGCLAFLVPGVAKVTRVTSYTPAVNQHLGIPPSADWRLVEWLEAMQIRCFRHVFCPSRTLADTLRRELGVGHIRLIRTPYFEETSAWDDSLYAERLAGTNYLLFFGRFERHKGVYVLIDALPEVLAAHRDCHAVLVGLDRNWGSPRGGWGKDYAREVCHEAAERLVLFDQMPHAQLYPIIAHARLVVLPSLVDNLPNALLEAMAAGRPVVGTSGTSFDEVIEDGRNGFLVPPGDSAALARKLIEVWPRQDLDEIGCRAKQTIREEFAPEKTVSELLAFYQEAIRGA